MKPLSLLAAPALVLGLAAPAAADDDEGRGPLARIGSPDVTVQAGAVLPLLLLYEFPGPFAGVSVEWRTRWPAWLVAGADVGVVHADGSRRYLGSLGAGVRLRPRRNGPWVQLGLGVTGFVERVGLVLPDRVVRATDTGAILTGDVALGVRVMRWELAVSYDHVLAPKPFYETYMGSEALPLVGAAMAWFGREL